MEFAETLKSNSLQCVFVYKGYNHCIVLYIYNRFPEAPAFEGVLEPNDILSKAQLLYQNEVLGPESIVIKGGN